MEMMATVSAQLQDYKDLIGTVAGVVTISQFLSGLFLCKDIYVQNSTEGVSPNPFVGGLVIGTLMLFYANILNDSAMLFVNISAIGLNVLYTAFYFLYCKNKGQFIKLMGKGAAFTLLIIGYGIVENPANIEHRFGLIVTVLMLVLIGSPLLEVREVIQKRDASSLPFPIILSGTLVSSLWLLYGIILMNEFMVFQNIIGFTLCVAQLVLCLMYPGKKKTA